MSIPSFAGLQYGTKKSGAGGYLLVSCTILPHKIFVVAGIGCRLCREACRAIVKAQCRQEQNEGGATQNLGATWEFWVKWRSPRGGHLTGFGGFGTICVHLDSYNSSVPIWANLPAVSWRTAVPRIRRRFLLDPAEIGVYWMQLVDRFSRLFRRAAAIPATRA